MNRLAAPPHIQLRPTPTVFIVDDDTNVRESLCSLFKSVDMKTQSFASAADFLENLQEDQPGCLITDVRMPNMSGIELQRHLLDKQIEMPVIFMTGYNDIAVVVEAMNAGAFDFIRKPYLPQALVERVRDALERDQQQRKLREQRALVVQRRSQLSPREAEVMDLLLSARSTKEVALELGISPKTVDNHRSQIFDKMRVNNIPTLMLMVLDTEKSKVPGKEQPSRYNPMKMRGAL